MPKEFSGNKSVPFKTVGQLIEAGGKLPQLEKQKWEKGQGARQTAYLCYSSGTSGLPVRTEDKSTFSTGYKIELGNKLTFNTERRYD